MKKYFDRGKKTLYREMLKALKQLFIHPSSIIKPEETYYPDEVHKTNYEIFIDQLKHIYKYGTYNNAYYIYGLDVKGAQCDDYIFEKWNIDNLRHQNRKYCGLKFDHDYIVTVADKNLFAEIMESNGFPIPKTYGFLLNGRLFKNGNIGTPVPLSTILDTPMHVLCKPITGNSGKGIIAITIENGILYHKGEETSIDDFYEMTKNGKYLIQLFVENQHPAMKALFPNSLNTLRVTMAREGEDIVLLGCMCLMGGDDAEYSNWHYGGICTTVDEDGRLGKYGYSMKLKRISQHPNTGVEFDGYQLPFYHETIEMCRKAMDVFYGMKTIGWDMAFTENGPVFIEANNGWGIAAHQMVDHSGWADRYHRVFNE